MEHRFTSASVSSHGAVGCSDRPRSRSRPQQAVGWKAANAYAAPALGSGACRASFPAGDRHLSTDWLGSEAELLWRYPHSVILSDKEESAPLGLGRFGIAYLSFLGACGPSPCTYSESVSGFTTIRLERDCGHADECDFSKAEVEVSIALDEEPCLSTTAAASINGRTVRPEGAGGMSVSQNEGFLPKSDRCECNSADFSTGRTLPLGEELTFALPAGGEDHVIRWATPPDFLRLEFPDGNPVPGGGRVIAFFAKTPPARVEAVLHAITADGQSISQSLNAPLERGAESQVWQVPRGEGARPGLYPVVVRWDRDESGCSGASSCGLSAYLSLTFDVRFE